MGLFDAFPYSNFHELNLDWLINAIKKLGKEMEDFEAINKIEYAGVWDITKSYPAWRIVTTESSAYVSTKAVPGGIAIDNAEYWQQLADIDPRILDLQNQINEIVKDFDTVIPILSKSVADNASEIEKTNSAVTNNANTIASVENSVVLADILFDNVIFIGDSFLKGEGSDNWDTDNFASQFANIVPMKKWQRFSNGGGGFVNPGSNGKTYMQTLNSDIDEYSRGFENDVTLFVVEGGYNDTYYSGVDFGNIQQPVIDFFNAVKTKYPNAKIVYFFNPLNKFYDCNTQIYLGIQQALINVGVINCTKSWSWLLSQSGLYSGNYNDNLHPNTLGYKCLASKLYSAIYGQDAGCSNESGFFAASGAAMRWYVMDGHLWLTISANNVTKNTVLFTAEEVPVWMKPNGHGNTFVIASGAGYCYLYQNTDGSIVLDGPIDTATNINGGIYINLLLAMGKEF